MSRICRWWYNVSSSSHSPLGAPAATMNMKAPSPLPQAEATTWLDGAFLCTCVKLGNCLTPCSWSECFAGCGAWSDWSHQCLFNLGDGPHLRNRTRTCLCDPSDTTYQQVNINSDCWQYATCDIHWEIFRLMIFIFTCAIIVKAFVLSATYFMACAHAPTNARRPADSSQSGGVDEQATAEEATWCGCAPRSVKTPV